MPRTKFDKPRYPPIDWMMAAILERKRVMKLEWSDIAVNCGMSSDSLRQLASKKPPEEWPKEIRNHVLKTLGLSAKMVIEEEKAVRF